MTDRKEQERQYFIDGEVIVELGLNRRLVRSIYDKVDWDQYDREVIAESLLIERQSLDVERLTEALATAMDPTASARRNDDPSGHNWRSEWRKALAWAGQFTAQQAAEYARLTQERNGQR